jgi:hypothetical protein
MRKIIAIGIVIVLVCVMVSGMVSGATPHHDSWDVSGDLAGWRVNAGSLHMHVEVVDTGGNPNGYLYTESTVPWGTIYWGGACTEKDEFTGDYNFAPTIRVSFDLKVFSITQNLNEIWLRFRYNGANYNGWYLVLNNPTLDVWVPYTVEFDPSWTDTEATTAGWNQEYMSVSYSTTMADVYWAEIRIKAASEIYAGIDNFQIEGVCKLEDIKDYINNLPENAWWKNPDQRANAMVNKLDAIADLIAAEDYEGAIEKLENDIRTKMDGDPTAPDWIVDETAQTELCEMIDSLIACLGAMT